MREAARVRQPLNFRVTDPLVWKGPGLESSFQLAGVILRDDRNSKLRGIAFGGNGLFRFLQAVDVAPGRVPGHE